MTITKMPPDKSQLLAYLKYTPGFEKKVWEFTDLTTEQILDKVREQDPEAYETCIQRYRERGAPLVPA